ncbi:MAG: helix-turn-helix domain-containing protein [Candidatus Sericytochromatia bacterium]
MSGLQWATRPVPSELQPYVRSYSLYAEHTPQPLLRRELPGAQVVVIFEWGPALKVYDSGSHTRYAHFGQGFVAGLDETFTLTEHGGWQQGLQLNLTPRGAQLFFGVSLAALRGRTLPLPELLPPELRCLPAQLYALRHHPSRCLDLLEAVLRRRCCDRGISPVSWACQQLERTTGAYPIEQLVAELGYSHKHVLRLFQEQVGLSPKRYGRLLRFEKLVALSAAPHVDWTQMALRLGFADQAHLSREVRAFAGITPVQLRAERLGEQFVQHKVNFVQDSGVI